MVSDECSRLSPDCYDSDCNLEQHRLNIEKMGLQEMHAYDKDYIIK